MLTLCRTQPSTLSLHPDFASEAALHRVTAHIAAFRVGGDASHEVCARRVARSLMDPPSAPASRL